MMRFKQSWASSQIQDYYFYEAFMLEDSTDVRFSGVKDIAKMTQAVLEYKMLIRTHHAGIK